MSVLPIAAPRGRLTRRVCAAAEDSKSEENPKTSATPRRRGFNWLRRAPQIRYRRPENRCPDQLLDLTVLNERLLGSSPWKVRRKVEYLKKRQENWDMVYEIIMKREAAATLNHIEEASQKVETVLSEQSKETKSIVELKKELTELQKEVNEAHEKLHMTQSQVLQTRKHVRQLKSQMEMNRASVGIQGMETPSMNMMNDTQNDVMHYWYPVAFSKDLSDENVLMPFELFSQPWVLFRDASGNAACVQDECAHRACPLSIGKIVDGEISCPYHGWQYNSTGSCVKMPSTVFRKDISINHLPVKEKDGFIWIWPGMDMLPDEEMPSYAEFPDGFVVLSEVEKTVSVDKGLLMSNLLDDEHTPSNPLVKSWVYGSSNEEDWMVPSMESDFEPPCCVTSTLDLMDLQKTGKNRHIHQLHVCLPVSRGKVRVLQRVSVNFWKWTSRLPLAQQVFTSMAEKALDKDLTLAMGQQDRMKQKGVH